MKILIISEFFPKSEKGEARGGVEIRAWEISKRLAKNNNVTILTSKEYGIPKEVSFLNMKVIRCGMNRKYTQNKDLFKRFVFMCSVFIKVIKLKPEIVDAQAIVGYLPGYFGAKIINAKKIITVHDVWIGKWKKLFGIYGYIGELYEKIYLSLNWNKIFTISHFTKNNLINYGISKDKICIVGNGIDLNKIENIQVQKYDSPTITTVSRLVKYKNINHLIEAIAKVKKVIHDIQCHIVGSGPEEKNLRELVNKLKLENNIIFDGFVKEHDEVLRLIKKSHIFCLASSVEGFGIVNIEAMACGVPVTASEIPPIKEVTNNGQGGLLFEVGDIDKIADDIIILIKDNEVKEKFVYAGHEIAKKYDWNRIASDTSNYYNNLLISI